MDDKDFLSCLDNLASSNDDNHLLENAQKMFAILSTAEYNTPTKASEFTSKLGPNISENLDYTMNRLIKGTCSDSYNTKIGFSFPLCNILRSSKLIQIDKLINIVFEHTDKKNALNKAERLHFHIARLLNLFVLISSERVDNTSNALDLYNIIYTTILENMNEYPWSVQLSLYIIKYSLTLVNEHDPKLNLKKANLLVKLRNKLKSSGQTDNTNNNLYDKLGFALILNEFFIKETKESNTTLDNIISKSMGDLSTLKKTIDNLLLTFSQKNLILKFWGSYIAQCVDIQSQKNFITNICNIIDQQMKDQDEKKLKIFFVILSLFKYYIKSPKFSPQIFEYIVNTSLLNLWLKNLHIKNNITYKIAKKIEKHLSTKILDILKSMKNIKSLELLKIFKTNPGYSFEPNNQLAIILFNHLDDNQMETYIQFLIDEFNQRRQSTEWIYYIGELQIIIEIKANELNQNSILKIANFLIVQSIYFNKTVDDLDFKENDQEEKIDKEDIVDKVNKKVKEEALKKFNSVMVRLMKIVHEDYKNKKNDIWMGFTKDLILWPLKILQEMSKILKEKKSDEEYLNVLKLAVKKCAKYNQEIQALLKNKSTENNSTKKLIGFCLLISCIALNLPLHPDLTESLEEIMIAVEDYQNVYLSDSKEKPNELKNKKQKITNEKDKPIKKSAKNNKSVQVINDIMISLLTRSSSYLREAINRCFKQLVDQIDDFCIGSLIGVIARSDKEYLAEMVDDEQQENDDMEDEEEEEIDNDKEEEKNVNNNDNEDDGDNNKNDNVKLAGENLKKQKKKKNKKSNKEKN